MFAISYSVCVCVYMSSSCESNFNVQDVQKIKAIFVLKCHVGVI